jgi:hypothetical protein
MAKLDQSAPFVISLDGEVYSDPASGLAMSLEWRSTAKTSQTS